MDFEVVIVFKCFWDIASFLLLKLFIVEREGSLLGIFLYKFVIFLIIGLIFREVIFKFVKFIVYLISFGVNLFCLGLKRYKFVLFFRSFCK